MTVLSVQRQAGASLAAVLLVLLISYCTKLLRGCTHRPNRALPPKALEVAMRALYFLGLGGILDSTVRCGSDMLLTSSPWLAAMVRLACGSLWAAWGTSFWSGAEKDGSGFRAEFQRWPLWRLVKRYFADSMQMVLSVEWRSIKAEEIARKRSSPQYLVGMHPHGSFPFGGMVNGLTEIGDTTNLSVDPKGLSPAGKPLDQAGAEPWPREDTPSVHTRWFPHLRLRAAAASFCFWVPGMREIFLRCGIIDCSEPYMRRLLKQGLSVAVFPGGARESGFATPGVYRLYLRGRRGFLRLALESGVSVFACYTFGDEAIWHSLVDAPAWLSSVVQIAKESLGILPPIWLHLIPNRVPLTTVVGIPIDFSDLRPPPGEPASEENLDIAMSRYIDMLQSLFDANKGLVPGNHGSAKLVIE
ncbi:unnamed protein product [Polarella glacialis]|uniref:Acyltransferase n=2 Tax=Polarella glacialis TaxID=89957 RepID=A0A813E2J5_POLGL|nr:unnamed protein product [Polarella glacialis]